MKIYKKHILCVIVGMTCLATILSFTAITGNDNLIRDKGYKLVFSDEFNLPNGRSPIAPSGKDAVAIQAVGQDGFPTVKMWYISRTADSCVEPYPTRT